MKVLFFKLLGSDVIEVLKDKGVQKFKFVSKLIVFSGKYFFIFLDMVLIIVIGIVVEFFLGII